MVSISRILGILLLIIGLLLFTIINIAGLAFMPFGGSTPPETNTIQIGALSNDDIFVGAVPAHPIFEFFTSIQITFELQSDNEYSCNVDLLFESQSIPVPQVIDGTSRNYGPEPSGTTTKTISTIISPQAARESFTISLRINNMGSNPITVSSRQVNVVYSFFGMVIPGLILLLGAILTVVSFVRGRSAGPKVKKRAAPGGWEPTLQWGGSSAASGTKTKATKKRPRMGISSTKGKSEKKTKIVKKTTPQGGAQLGCKFCGKPVPQNAFFCPHCYGKLK
jgi:hypothetical protein